MKQVYSRFLTLLLAVCFMSGALTGFAEEPEPIASGDFTYFLEDGQAIIAGYTGDAAELVIPDTLDGYPVTGIGDNAFEWNDSLTGMVIPGSVLSIGSGSFYGCKNLTVITIPDHVTSIGANPFALCRKANIVISAGNPVFTLIDGVLFDASRKMLISYPAAGEGAYIIPEGTLLIGDNAFLSCDGLTGVTIPDSITGIGSGAFFKCGKLTDLNIPDGVTVIGAGTFYGCSGLTDLTLPEGVTSIGNGAFSGCSGITVMTLPHTVTDIGFYAFEACGDLTSLFVPAGVAAIGTAAFIDCPNLTLKVVEGSYAEQYAKENNIQYVIIEGC